jgi:hypothetical protein
MAILESIAAANAAYSVIRTALSNGKETANLMSSIGKFLSAEEDIKSAVERKKKSPLTAITGGEEGDWEEFQALEDIRQKRAELESWCRLYAPSGTWDRWVSYEAKVRTQRAEAKKAAMKAREKRNEQIAMALAITLAFSTCIAGLYYIGQYMGKW